MTRILRFSAAILICLAVAGQQAVHQARIDHDEEVALAHITADSLRGHLSFLSSDLLEGRDTPSRGLDIAAEYIAAQFRRVGLEAPVNGGYFQTADLMLSERDMKRFEFRVTAGDRSFAINNQDVAIPDPGPLRLTPRRCSKWIGRRLRRRASLRSRSKERCCCSNSSRTR